MLNLIAHCLGNKSRETVPFFVENPKSKMFGKKAPTSTNKLGERPTILDSHSDKALEDFIDQKRDEKMYKKSDPIFRCTTPSTNKGHQTVTDVPGVDSLFGIHKAYGTSNRVVY